MYKPWFLCIAVAVLLGCLGFMASEDEDKREHNDYCLRVLIHTMDETLGHRDYENRCTAEDLEQARDVLESAE